MSDLTTRRMERLARVGLALVTLCAIVLTAPGVAHGQESDEDVVVAAYELEPFVVRTGDAPRGIMFEVWQIVAGELGWSYEVRWVDSLDDLAEVLAADDVDVAVAPLSATRQREQRFDFTAGLVASGPVFGVHERTENPITLASALFSRDTLRLLLWSALGLLVLGHLMWFVDRRNPESDLARTYGRGIWDGVWWATVTVTTVGYGDTSPKTAAGRVVAMLAMVGSLFLVGAFVSEVTTTLQSERASTIVAGVDDLDGRRVGVVEGSTYQAYLADLGVETVGYTTQAEVFEGASDGDLDVIVADRFALDALGGDYGIRSTDEPLYDEFISFGVRDDSPLEEDIDAIVADLHGQGVIREIVERWTD